MHAMLASPAPDWARSRPLQAAGRTLGRAPGRTRLLIVPGLHGSSTDHWQSRLEREHPDAVRIRLDDWGHADLDKWAQAIARAMVEADQADRVARQRPVAAVADPSTRHRNALISAQPVPPTTWVAVAHSFGCLALAHHLLGQGVGGVSAALMVAPANPDRFGVPEGLLDQRLPVDSTLVFSRNDPWMSAADARYLGERWGSELVDAGEAGHINPASGHGSLPVARLWVDGHLRTHEPDAGPLADEAGRTWRISL